MKSIAKTAVFVKAILIFSGLLIVADNVYGQVPITNPSPGQVIISEFRLRGPNGENDEFIEIYNATDSTIRVIDQSSNADHQLLCPAGVVLTPQCGWALVDLSNSVGGSPTFVIPVNTEIPPRGHYLITNNGASGYSLTGYATANGSYTSEIVDGTGIALFKTAHTAAYNGSNICFGGVGVTNAPCALDGVGFDNNASPYREGTGLTTISTSGEYSFVRRFTTSGIPQDTNINADDFVLVSTNAAVYDGVQSILGAPGPENLTSPRRNTAITTGIVNTGEAAFGTNNNNYNRDTNPVTNGAAGRMSFRRTLTNPAGASGNITQIRIRIRDITTLNSPGYVSGGSQADLRALTSSTIEVTFTGGVGGTASGITLEEPPTQSLGGGLNSSWNVPLLGGLAPGQTIAVNITVGVQQAGSFRFAVIIEALP